ncbi:hypothetical protein ON010_g8766 [Phytophthora cinnamomi]|nr:hypothetical protein ON010_g8766 [Phytophthora cinnamomi]
MANTGKKTKGKNFRAAELDRMLPLVESSFPFGSEQWANIASSYNAHLPSGWPERDGDSLRRKFMPLKNKRKPTEDLDCPSEIKQEADLEPEGGPYSDGFGDADHGLEAFSSESDGAGDAPATDSVHDEDAPTPLRVTVAEGPSTPSPPQPTSSRVTTSTTAALSAIARAGLTPTQLAQLSTRISRVSGFRYFARKRRGGSNLLGVIMMMEERQAARDAEVRREREEREAVREARERQFQLELARSQGAREAQSQQLVMLLMAKIFGVPPPSASNE